MGFLTLSYLKSNKGLPNAIQIPCCVTVPGRDLVDQARDRSSQSYKFLLQRVKRFRLVDGVIINSFLEIEEYPIEAITEEGNENFLIVKPSFVCYWAHYPNTNKA